MRELEPGEIFILPMGQSSQSSDEVAPLKFWSIHFPGEQFIHALKPIFPAYFPDGHKVQVFSEFELILAEARPTGHPIQTAAP